LEERSSSMRKDGKEQRGGGSIAPIYDERGSFSGFVAALRDVTGRKQEESALDQNAGEFRQNQEMETIGLQVGGLAHEFNQLLTVILGNSSLVLGQLSQSDPNHELLANVEKAALRATAVVKQLL